MNIVCRKTCCKFNKNFVCKAPQLEVGTNSQCNTFVDDKTQEIDTSKALYQKPPKVEKYRHAKHLKITCQAPCQFNQDCICHANGITVNDLSECPYCVTYFKKIKK